MSRHARLVQINVAPRPAAAPPLALQCSSEHGAEPVLDYVCPDSATCFSSCTSSRQRSNVTSTDVETTAPTNFVLPDHAELGHRVYELQGNGGSGPLAGSAQPSQGPQPRWAQQQHWLAHCRPSVGGVFPKATAPNCLEEAPTLASMEFWSSGIDLSISGEGSTYLLCSHR